MGALGSLITLISIIVGLGGVVATVIFVVKDKTRAQTVQSQGELIQTLQADVMQLRDHDLVKKEQIEHLQKEVVKLRGEINGKDLLIVTALKQYFTDNPDMVKKVAKDFRQVLAIN